MPVEALWRWLREDVTYHHCHPTADDLRRRVAAFAARLNQDPCAVADRLWVEDQLDPEEEKLRFSKQTRFRISAPTTGRSMHHACASRRSASVASRSAKAAAAVAAAASFRVRTNHRTRAVV